MTPGHSRGRARTLGLFGNSRYPVHRRATSVGVLTAHTSDEAFVEHNARRALLRDLDTELKRYELESETVRPYLPSLIPLEEDSAQKSHLRTLICQRLLDNPISVSDDDVAIAFDTVEACKSDATSNGRRCYYQSWRTTKKGLSKIIDGLENLGFVCEQISRWKVQLNRQRDDDEFVWIRYVGQTTNTAYKRCMLQDGTEKRNTFKAEFKKQYKIVHPRRKDQVHRAFTIEYTDTKWMFKDRKLEPITKLTENSICELADFFERLFFILLGSTSLLNAVSGGRQIRFVATREHLELLGRLKTSVMDRIGQSKLEHPSPQAAAGLKSLTDRICRYIAATSPELDPDSCTVPYVGRHYAKQASSNLFYGRSLQAVIAETVSKQSLILDTGFFDGDSQTKNLFMGYLEALAAHEAGFVGKAPDISSLIRLTSFSNVFNWRNGDKGDHIVEARGIVYAYLQAVQPLLVLTLGGKATRFCIGHIVVYNIIDHVGTARLARITTKDGTRCLIMFPQLHPGFDAHTDRSAAARHLPFLSMIHYWVHLETVCEYLARGETLDIDESREAFCKAVMQTAKEKLERVQYQSRLTRTKEQYLSRVCLHQASTRRATTGNPSKGHELKRPNSSSDIESTKTLDFDSQIKLISEQSRFLDNLRLLRQPLGAPDDPGRMRWIHSKWQHREELLKDLCTTKEQFKSIMLKEPAGYFTSVSIAAHLGLQKLPSRIRDLLQQEAQNEGVELDDSTKTLKVRRKMLQDIAKNMLEDKEIWRKQKERKVMVLRHNELETHDLSTRSGSSNFKFQSSDGETRTLVLRRGLFKCETQFSRRFLEFSDVGINVKNEHGEIQYPANVLKSGPSMPKDSLESFSENLPWLWEQVMGEPQNKRRRTA